MPVLVIIIVLSLIAAGINSLVHEEIEQAVMVKGELTARSSNIVVYRGLVREFADGHPNYVGTVNLASLNAPNWFQPLPELGNYVVAGVVYVFHIQPPPGLAGELAMRVQSTAIGTNIGGVLYSPGAGDTGISVPPQVPQNATVILQ